MAGKANSEVKAMDVIWGALSGLEPDEQKRVLTWVIDKLKLSGSVSLGTAAPGAPQTPQSSGSSPSTGSGAELTPKQFMAQKSPKTDEERITCLAYFMTHHRNTTQFKTKDLTDLNVQAAGVPFSNSTVATDNAAKSKYLAAAGGGRKQITSRGEALVDVLPDREKVKAFKHENPARRRKSSKAKHRKSGG